MHTVKLLAALGALSFSALVDAQSYSESQAFFACQCAVLDPWGGGGGGIDDLNVGGHLFDVTFTNTAPGTSPFAFSTTAAKPGQAATGIDAGNAIAAFYATLQPPYADGYQLAGDPGPGFVTAFAPAGALSSQYYGSTQVFDFVQTDVGSHGITAVTGQLPGTNVFFSIGPSGGGPFYTTWTPVAPMAAPEMDPTSAMSAVTLFLGSFLVIRGRTRKLD